MDTNKIDLRYVTGIKYDGDIDGLVANYQQSLTDVKCSAYSYSRETKNDITENLSLKIKDYKVNGPAVIVFFTDGTKEVSVCDMQDVFDLNVGITNCIMKKIYGNNYYSQIGKIIKTIDKQHQDEIESQKQAEANKEKRIERIEKNRQKKIERQARHELAVEEEKKKIKNKKIL